jgi:hypothetical protein
LFRNRDSVAVQMIEILPRGQDNGFKRALDASRVGQQISNAMSPHTAASDGNILCFLHICLCASDRCNGRFGESLTGTQGRTGRSLCKGDPKGEPAMPTLVWIAFWSSIVGTAMCLQQATLPGRAKAAKVKTDDRSRS